VISGRRDASGNLGLVRTPRGVQIYGIGSYESVSGTPSQPGPAEQTLLGVVQVTAPAGPYTVWAERSGLGPFESQPAQNRLLYVLNEQQIAAAERLIGEPPAYLAVITDLPVDGSSMSRVFEDSRYQWQKTEALYAQSDPNRVPRMTFLHWASLRPATDWKGRTATERTVAQRVGGILVFPVAVPVAPGDREPPQSTFEEALKAQFPNGSPQPVAVAAPEGGSAVAIAEQSAAKNSLALLAILGLGCAAAWVGSKVVGEMRGRTA